MYTVALVGLLAVGAFADIRGACPDRTALKVDLTSYDGTWYMAASKGVKLDVLTTKCDSSVLTVNDTTGVLTFDNTAYMKAGGAKVQYSATAVVLDDGTIVATTNDGRLSAPYKVLATDYTNFSLLTACFEKTVMGQTFHAETSYILTREQFPHIDDIPSEVRNKIDSAVLSAGWTRSEFDEFDNTDCPKE